MKVFGFNNRPLPNFDVNFNRYLDEKTDRMLDCSRYGQRLFIWVYVKEIIYQNKLDNIEGLKYKVWLESNNILAEAPSTDFAIASKDAK